MGTVVLRLAKEENLGKDDQDLKTMGVSIIYDRRIEVGLM